MAAPFLRLGRLSEQRLRMESSFGTLRGTPNVVNFNTKAGNPKKPIRYTSIKKAKPKTIIDIGKLLLQRANDATVNKQSVIADAALKAATQTAKLAALSDLSAADASTQKAPSAPSSSAAESVTLVAAGFVDATSKTSDALKPPVLSSPSVKGEPTATKKIPPEESGSLGLSPPFGTSFKATRGEMEESPQKTAHKNTGTFTAPPEAVSDADPIDVTYSEDVDPVSDFNDIEVASKEPSVGVLSNTDTVTAEIVGSQSISAADIHATPEVLIPEISPAGYSSTKATPTAEGVEIIHALDDATSPLSLSSEHVPSKVEVTQTQMQDVRPLTSATPADLACYASSSKIISEEIAPEITPEAKVSPHAVLEHAMTEHGVDFDSAKAVSPDSISRVIPVGRAHQHNTAEIPGDSSSRAEERVAMAGRVLNLTPETVFEASVAQSPEPVKGEFAEDGLKTEGEEAVKESLEAKLDPVKRLFLDKIREYSTKSKACNGLVDAGPEYERGFSEELTKLQRLYGNGDLTAFPEFKFPEPVLDEISSK
ncbi:endochitinase A isoform X1 [Pygocentrus nattereri]|uniref:ATP synthase peripheral stalk subunit F6, mitochondrial n=1 Tax=Pygocentrus nattereri TaxID=42514 RepID=A0AAR2L468_PYGNA|nr:endochitinase A isoform X1 [Pygocentrus nattereri]